ncbi:T9SS type A sorting domain-containing protein [Parvicella tangerina]|uniref:T9SS type A sorting domain-containing protein n=1 Tax=Parvicella tangerina TaxID=2829795 RepID=UPI00215D4853|nr:T9SS type A sorting domain-containing protein [Parvicella tangerina]
MIGQTNRWSVTNCFNGCLTDTYFLDGDTTINGKGYRVLNGYHFISGSFLIREEVASKKVFIGIINGNKLDEYLVYDFGIQVGDSVQVFNPISPLPTNVGKLYLDSTSTQVLDDGIFHNVFYLSTVNNQYRPVWIEGVGSLTLINTPCATPDVNSVGHLSCYTRNDIFTYSNLDSIESCSSHIALSSDSFSESKKTISITNTNTLVKIENLPSYCQIGIYSMNGLLLHQENLGEAATPEIDINHLAKGIYLITVTSSNEFWSKKFIKL